MKRLAAPAPLCRRVLKRIEPRQRPVAGHVPWQISGSERACVISNLISWAQVRYVLDTCVVVAALRSRNGASNLILRTALLGQLPVVCHYKMLAEYRNVLQRMAKGGESTYSPEQLERFLAALVTASEEVDVRYLWRPNLRDEGDNFAYELAFAASPATIVTHNVRDFAKAEIAWPGLFVKTPRQVLQEVSQHA